MPFEPIRVSAPETSECCIQNRPTGTAGGTKGDGIPPGMAWRLVTMNISKSANNSLSSWIRARPSA